MTKEELLDLIGSWENLNLLIREIINHPDIIYVLADIALYSDNPKSWRAAWMIEKIYDNNPNLVEPFLPKIIHQLESEKHDGKKRHFLKLISLNPIPEKFQGFLFDYCFEAFTSSKVHTAVRVNAMQILYNLSEIQPQLKPEILAIIDHEMEFHSTAGIVSRGRKLKVTLRKQISKTNI